MNPLIELILANAAPSGTRQAIVFLALIVALLGAFVFIVALITALRRRARREAEKRDRAAVDPPDAWQEAGRRLKP